MNTPRIIASAALAAALLSPSALLAQYDAGSVFDGEIKKLQKKQEAIQKLKKAVHDAVEIGKKEKLRRDEERKKQDRIDKCNRRNYNVPYDYQLCIDGVPTYLSNACSLRTLTHPFRSNDAYLPAHLIFNLI